MAGTHQAPPESIGVGVKVVILALLRQVHQERGQDEAEEADVPGGDQLLEGKATSRPPGQHPAHSAAGGPRALLPKEACPQVQDTPPECTEPRQPRPAAAHCAARAQARGRRAAGGRQQGAGQGSWSRARPWVVPAPVHLTLGRTVAEDGQHAPSAQVWECPQAALRPKNLGT